jgi:hypothetical protein
VNLGFATKFLTPSERTQLKGSGKTTRVMEFRSLQEIEEDRLRKMLRLVWDRKPMP